MSDKSSPMTSMRLQHVAR